MNIGKLTNGFVSQGGYADKIRVQERFAFKIPNEIKPEEAAPLMCAGVTVFNPLKTHGCTSGKTVGIVGIGGLGHFGILFAKVSRKKPCSGP